MVSDKQWADIDRPGLNINVLELASEDFLNAHANMKERLSAQGWAHTTMEKVEVVHEGPDKVHLAILQHREHADGTVYRPFETLWIMTLQDGHWGVQFRSSFLR